MNYNIKKYIKEVEIMLPCNRKNKKIVMGVFLHSIENYLSDYPNSTYDDLVEAFGTPTEMAETLSETLSENDIKKYKYNKKLMFWIFVILLFLFVIYSIYIFCFATVPVNVTQTIIIE